MVWMSRKRSKDFEEKRVEYMIYFPATQKIPYIETFLCVARNKIESAPLDFQ